MPSPEENKKAALDFLNLVVAGQIDEAYEKYVDMAGRHHNAYFAAGFPVLKEAMKESQAKFPNKKFEVKHALADGELVITHSHVVIEPNSPGLIVAHLFRFSNGKIVEMWDFGQPIDAGSPNADGPF